MIELQNLSKHFGPVRALDGIDLSIDQVKPTGLVGPNGAGKTTLFSVLCGFLNPTSGRVRIAGHPPLAKALHGQIAILPQDAALSPAVPIAKQLEFMAQLQGFDRRGARAETARTLELVNLSDVAMRPPEALSHGMRKRAAIAQAFIGEPDLVLLDEPTAGLDPNTAAPIRELIRTTAHERKFVRNPPAILQSMLPEDRTLSNPFYYYSGSEWEEALKTYGFLLRDLAERAPNIVLVVSA